MRFLILADRPARDLFPISNHISPPMLPVAGRPVIEHVLSMIAAKGGGRVDVLLAPGDTRTQPYLEAVQWPALDVRVVREAVTSTEWRVAIRGDVCPHPEGLDPAIAACRDHRPMRALERSALAVIAPGEAPPSWAAFVTAATPRGQVERWPGLFLSLADYHALALSAVGRRLGWAGITPAGWREPDGTRIGLRTRVGPRGRLGPGTSLGARAVIGSGVTMSEGAVVGDDCFVGDDAHLARSIILDGTFVGSGLEIRNAIVAGRWIYDVARGVGTRAPDRFLRSRSL